MHGFVIRLGWLRSVFVGCSLIHMYGKCLRVDDAALVFDEMPDRNTVCVNALLSGYVEAKKWREGLELVRNMNGLNLDCDSLTLSGALRACAGLPAMDLGRQVHGFVIRRVSDVVCDVHLQSLLIEMYGKCGLVGKARQVFEKLGFEQGGENEKDVVLWTSMLGAYGRNGDFEEVINLFRVMLIEGTRPDGISFLTVISACGHSGQVELGMEYFESMSRDFGLVHDPEHYSCVIDLLSRAGELDKAWKLVCEMPHVESINHTISLWGSLLSACYECGNVELGKLAAQKALELEPQNVGIYLLLSNIYAKNGMWDAIEQLREVMNERGVKKDIGRSWVDLST
ncbi:hypothetical protein LIER_10961 [Lithospermum erythrorhizon]|uniref:Pentatricopeptide repeat-containing protein n=1 Tax=Lithospermum erythrorhizon TaxID=34254 RepID=A0AAV3PMT2_LITER